MEVIVLEQGMFSAHREDLGDATHLRLRGEIDVATVPQLERAILAAEQAGYPRLVLDLREVTFMDSSGIDPFLRAMERAGPDGRALSIVNAPAGVRRVLEITGTAHMLTDLSAA